MGGVNLGVVCLGVVSDVGIGVGVIVVVCRGYGWGGIHRVVVRVVI